MIRFENVYKSYEIGKFHKQVLNGLNFEIETGSSIGICGINGAGKSTLVRLISGVEAPTSGKIFRDQICSWPIGYSSCFQASLTGADNARFIARIYNQPAGPLLEYVEDFAQLGPYFYQPIFTYSAGMVARLAFGISLAVNFDCYLIDEVTGAGDDRFAARCHEAIVARRDSGTLIMISHNPDTLMQYCTTGAVLRNGNLEFYPTVEEAIEKHRDYQRQMG